MTDLQQASRAFEQAAHRTTTLYELSDDYLRLIDLLEDPDVDPAFVEAELDRVAPLIKHKAEAIAGLITEFEGIAAMRKAEAKRMADSATRAERQGERLRAYLLQHLLRLPPAEQHIETARFTISPRQGPPRVEILEARLVPHEFQRERITIDVDKKAILDHVKKTGEVPSGVEIVRGTRLDIR